MAVVPVHLREARQFVHSPQSRNSSAAAMATRVLFRTCPVKHVSQFAIYWTRVRLRAFTDGPPAAHLVAASSRDYLAELNEDL